MAKLIPEEAPRFSDADSLEGQISEYVKVKASLDILTTRQKELRDKLFEQLDQFGEEDSKGNIQLELDSAIDGVARLEKQRRVTRTLNELVAEEIIEANGLGEEVYKTVRQIDEDALMAAHYEGKISEEDLDNMFPAKVVWALMTKKS
jgi:hypothetical protein